eukprot:CAMPEP_0185256870 /NCGR_PEP_ID=MMETSP1359-20130426/5939_1 /TAXON_ID=552665 /ORGANISM="Bigelowiella longifila, Strain CCMP242" /LENGTH=420 /DNA_ID=CAMNT_0027841661 /DNA_START=96 /DNA_END=1358 /DNA_ORIENTATION=+
MIARNVDAKRKRSDGAATQSHNSRLLWAVAFLLAIGVPGYLLRPRGPIEGPWQFLITLTLAAAAIVMWIAITFLRVLANAVYTSANLKTQPSEHMKVMFDAASYFIFFSTAASIVVSVATDDRRYEAMCYGSLLIATILFDPYIIVMLYKLHKIIATHLKTLRKYDDGFTNAKGKFSTKISKFPTTASTTIIMNRQVCTNGSEVKSNRYPQVLKYEEEAHQAESKNDTSGILRATIPLMEIASKNASGIAKGHSAVGVPSGGVTSDVDSVPPLIPVEEIKITKIPRRQTIAAMRRNADIAKYISLLRKLKMSIFIISVIVVLAIGLLLNTILDRIQNSETLSESYSRDQESDGILQYITVFFFLMTVVFVVWYAGGPWEGDICIYLSRASTAPTSSTKENKSSQQSNVVSAACVRSKVIV